ncbi:MAG: cytochrome c biogenesis protein CcsA [Anaerolineae bacterium]|nr:cytochrome c biogenesis protein CcsA [Anaerolineae bacterium]
MSIAHQAPGISGTTATETAASIQTPSMLRILTLATLIGIALGLYMALIFAKTDAVQGDVQRIFYIHMPAFMGAFVAFSMTVLGGVMYLRTRKARWDTLAVAGVEVGIALALVNITTGMIWARPIWNAWWTWDPRLTLEAIMALTYGAYLVLRNAIENSETRRRFAAVYGILAIITVLLTLVISRIRPDTIHPTVFGPSSQNAQGGFAVSGGMGAAIGVNMLVWAVLVPVTLIWYRIRLQDKLEQLATLKRKVFSR